MNGKLPLDAFRQSFSYDPSCKLWLSFTRHGAEALRIIDRSGNGNHGTVTGAVPYPGNPQLTGIGSTFNRGDFTSTNAFFWSSLDLSPYAGTDLGSTPYWIRVVDGAGKLATGYLAGVGAGETLSGTELVTNGGFDADTDWNKNPGVTISGGVLDINNIIDGQAYQYIPCVKYRLYKGVVTVLNYVSGTANMMIGTIRSGGILNGNGVFTFYSTEPSGDGFASVQRESGTLKLQADNYSVKRVFDPPSTGLHIVSSLNGTTRAWEGIEAGFDPDTIASWSIHSVIPSECIGWYFDDVDDRVVHASINFGKTHTLLYWFRSFNNVKGIVHGGAANYHVAMDETNLYYNAGATELEQAHGGGVNKPIMIGIVRSGTTVQFFLNGIQVGTDQTLDANNNQTLTTLGSYDTPGTFFGGIRLEDIGFTKTFSAQDIRNYYELTRHIYGI